MRDTVWALPDVRMHVCMHVRNVLRVQPRVHMHVHVCASVGG